MDEQLNPAVAEALRKVGYNIVSIKEAFDGRLGVLDPEVIEWCRCNNAIWITADEKAKKQHVADICSSKIKVIWVHRKKGGMTAKEQLRVLSYTLPDLISRFANHRKHHYKIKIFGSEDKEKIKVDEIDLGIEWT
ncbi:MAG: DUF5615 family PIN-like protein [Dehalogenimonas sp.]